MRSEILTGMATRRVNGARKELIRRASRCQKVLGTIEDQNSPEAAALRGKIRAYTEAADLVQRVDKGNKLSQWRSNKLDREMGLL